MKFVAIVTLALGLSLSSCTSEAKTGVAGAANAMAGAADAVTTKAFSGALDAIKGALAGVTNTDTAKAAAGALTPLLETAKGAFQKMGGVNLGEIMKKLGGTLPAEVNTAVEGVTKEVTRVSGNADMKGALGTALEQITNMLKK